MRWVRPWVSIVAIGAVSTGLAQMPSLEEVVRVALEDSPDLATAQARVEAARAAIRQARSAWWPQLLGSAGYTRTDNPPQAFMMSLNQRRLDMRSPLFDPNEPDDTDNTRLELQVRQLLLDFGRRSAGQEAAEAMARANEAAERGARNQLVFEVTRAYYSVQQAAAVAEVYVAQVQSIQESLRVARERLERGAVVRSDVLSLEVRLAEAQEEMVRARNAVELAVAALNTAVGKDVLTVNAVAVTVPQEVPPPPPAPCEHCLEEHPMLKAAAAVAEARRSQVRRARAEFAPTLYAFAAYDLDSGDAREFEDSYLAGVNLEWTLFDGARRRHALAEARAESDAADAEVRRARQQLQLELRQAIVRVREAYERWSVLGRSEESAAEALRLVRARYEQGAAELPELLNAEVALTSVRSRRTAALFEYLIAQANLRRAEGRAAELNPARARPTNDEEAAAAGPAMGKGVQP